MPKGRASNVNNIHFVKDYFSTAFIRGGGVRGGGGRNIFGISIGGAQVKLGFWVGIGTLGGVDFLRSD